MKKLVLILTYMAGVSLILTGCGTKRVPLKYRMAFVDYMNQKYKEEFEIEEVEYARKSTHDPAIPFPDFMESYSDDLRAVLTVRNQSEGTEEDKRILAYYNSETEEFTDNYQEEEIKKNLLYFVLNEELDNIQEISDCNSYYSYKNSEVIYPQGKDGYYDLEQYQPEYAYQYLREHEVSVRLMDEKLNVVCNPDEEEEILTRFDVIFQELFRGDSNSATIWFYRPEDRAAAGEDAEPFMYIDYRDGAREDVYLTSNSDR